MARQLNESTTYGQDGTVLQSVVTTVPKAESSVEVTTNSKGEPQLTVKVYAENVKVALNTCLEIYEDGLLTLQVIRAKLDGIKKIEQTKG